LLNDEQSSLDLASAHAATQASESRKLAILQSSLDAIVTIDGAGRVIEFNRAAETLFGYAADYAQGKPMETLIVPHHLSAQHLEGMARYQALGTPRVLNRRIEIEARHADGTVFPVELTIVPIQTETGELFTATLRDIRARRQAEEELGAARRRELQIGVQIQQSLLMTTTPADLAGLRISSHSQASKGIDGDFLEIIRIGPHCVDIITGDVMGKGLAAALMGAATKMQFSRSIAELVTQSGNIHNQACTTSLQKNHWTNRSNPWIARGPWHTLQEAPRIGAPSYLHRFFESYAPCAHYSTPITN
jgi:PAS domain S-box-containing protein